MKSATICTEEPKMDTRVLMPPEFSLVVTKRPLPPLDRLVPVEECLKICSSIKNIPAGSKFLPFSGTVRADNLPLLPYLQVFDMRSRFGGYDALDESGRRICNWVRFLKLSPIYNPDVNIVGHRYGPRGEVIFEVVKDISYGEELMAYLIPDAGSASESFLLPALQILRSSFYRKTIDTIMADAPLDLSRSLISSSKNEKRIDSPLSTKFTSGTSDAEDIHSDESQDSPIPSPSSSSSSSLSPVHPPPSLVVPTHNPFSISPQGIFLTSPELRVSPSLTTPKERSFTSSLLHSHPKSNRSSPIPHLVKRRERTMLPCSECGKSFDRPSLLKRHMRTHTGEKPHVCDVCGKGFSTSSSLNTHRRIHSGEKPHQCCVCGKRFTASSNLYYHKMTHIKEKPHKCTLCTRSFPTPGDLRSHMFVHNGQWPHKCNVCGKGFSKLTNLRNHTLLHSTKSQTISSPIPVTRPVDSPTIMESDSS